MNKAKKALLISIVGVSLAGCSGTPAAQETKSGPDAVPVVDNKPVTLTIVVPPYADGNFKEYVEKPVAAKFPNITFEKIASNNWEEVMASGAKPDLYIIGQDKFPQMKNLGILDNMDPFIKKFNMDMSRFDTQYLDSIKSTSGEAYLPALPFYSGFYVTYYNKDIFDKFGVEYPKDGMTWDEMIELGKKLTVMENGTQFRGLLPVNGPQIPASQLELKFFDDQKKPAVNNEGWKQVLETMHNIYRIPGNEEIVFDNKAIDQFLKERRVAMLFGSNLFSSLKDATDLNWDVVTYPVHTQAPDKGTEALAIVLGVTSMSQNKDAAFQVITAALSDEVQEELSKNAGITVLQTGKIQSMFGQNLPYLKEKNASAAFKIKRVKGYQNYGAAGIMITALQEIVKGKDTNTALREAEEKLVKHMEKLIVK
ncbi:ABC transporter substrate-binding protein [Paenibacillus silviterrae]|uniref:ABC transporter substrate-binding protein n=1 Tax=Paenibacillus silviterrae TaxID=3242194 RepID=UPI002542D69C|nr:extracellular solute-binding protein [Paenibacillus chinjuensis]